MHKLNSLYGVHPDRMMSFLGEYFPVYRSRQLLKWIYQKYVFDPAEMTDLPSEVKEFVLSSFDLALPRIDGELASKDGSRKFRLKLGDNSLIEMVLMPEAKKNTLCVSTQVGCARGCAFCATGAMGLKRNLETHELVQQVLLAAVLSPRKISNLVLMGMGEPLDNLATVLDFLRLIQHEHALAFSPRRTTLSTCGIVPGIVKLADSGVKLKLALSLNSAVEDVRRQLMPVAAKYPLADLKRALLYYQRKSSFRVTLEYILIPGLNMSASDLKALRYFSGDLSCKINFIPYNETEFLPYRAPTETETESFMAAARALPQAITLRRSKGTDISGACGQLVISVAGKTRRANDSGDNEPIRSSRQGSRVPKPKETK